MDEFNIALTRALRYLNLRARSKKELRDYLFKKKFETQIIDRVIEKLIELKFLDDKNYGESFMRGRQVYKGKSKYFIKHELKQKGIDGNIIEEISESAQDDLKTARDFIERKRRVYSKLDDNEFKEKMMRLLSSRGFSFDIIIKALKEE
jgi:regulatory protein